MAVAHSMATAEFLAELLRRVPWSFRPPWMNKLAIFSLILRNFYLLGLSPLIIADLLTFFKYLLSLS
jgi:hypothetical protein